MFRGPANLDPAPGFDPVAERLGKDVPVYHGNIFREDTPPEDKALERLPVTPPSAPTPNIRHLLGHAHLRGEPNLPPQGGVLHEVADVYS